tara:strand:+ start:207 stop:524 length:318 start_codon:yes stop_codon:yes gene_type:complete
MNTLSKVLASKGIKDESELSDEEKAQFENWRAILAKEELTMEDVVKFCNAQIDNIEAQFKDLENSQDKVKGLVLQHSIYKTLASIIKSPSVERESLERYLTDLIK